MTEQSTKQQPIMSPEEKRLLQEQLNRDKDFHEEQILGYQTQLGALHRTSPAPTETSTVINDPTDKRHHVYVHGLDTAGPAGPVIEKKPEDLTDKERADIASNDAKSAARKRFYGSSR